MKEEDQNKHRIVRLTVEYQNKKIEELVMMIQAVISTV